MNLLLVFLRLLGFFLAIHAFGHFVILPYSYSL